MDNIMIWVKAAIAAAGAFISAKFGALGPVLAALGIAMFLDYIAGMAASKKEAIAGIEGAGWNSKKGMAGILKKFGYLVAVGVAMIIDWIVFEVAGQIGVTVAMTTFFGLLVAIWFILNEALSIIENLGRMGVPLPAFLKKSVAVLIGRVEDVGNQQAGDEQGEGKE